MQERAERFGDDAYEQAGAQLVDAAQALAAELVLKVRPPNTHELSGIQPGAVLIGMLDPFNAEGLEALAALTESSLSRYMGVFAVALAAVNVFGGFLVTRRMLEMFKKKERKGGQ